MRYRWLCSVFILLTTIACSIGTLPPFSKDVGAPAGVTVTAAVETADKTGVEVVVQNSSPYPVCEVYIAESALDVWGKNWLSQDSVIAPEETRVFTLPVSHYDVLLLDCSGAVMATAWQVNTRVVLSVGGEDKVPFYLENSSEQDVCYLFISSTDDAVWGEDLLGFDEAVPSGGRVRLFFVDSGVYDLLAVDCYDNEIASEYGVEIVERKVWSITGEAPEGEEDGDFAVIVENRTPYGICYVLISPSEAEDWGEDWLSPAETLAPGASARFVVPGGRYDILLQDCEGFVLDSAWNIDENLTLRPGAQGDVPLKVTNESSKDVCYLHITPAAEDDWGPDWLASEEVLLAGEGQRIFFVEPGVYSLAVRDCDGNILTTEYEILIDQELFWRLEN